MGEFKMSFSSEAKLEISQGKALSARIKRCQGDAFLLFSRNDHEEIINKKTSFNRDSLRSTEQIYAFIAGAFLACGNVNHPEKGYHLEFVVRNEPLCQEFASLLEEFAPGVKTTRRRGFCVLYYRECAQIVDILTAMGASKAALEMINVEIVKDVRNKANRATNCETANIDKLVRASELQTRDIELIFSAKGENFLPETLRQIARVRLDNPEMSLRDIADEMYISRSGAKHRLDRLKKIAQQLRVEN